MAGMRSVLSLDINLGLFGFPVKVYKGTNDPNEALRSGRFTRRAAPRSIR